MKPTTERIETTGATARGGNAIRYLYHPYHPWRHGYRREKIKKVMFKAARILLLFELLWLAVSYAKSGMTEKTYRTLKSGPKFSGESAVETEGEFYGIGIEKGAGNLFWFHKEVRELP